nr:uncharacterized protein LOC110374999 isoform X1 [Helicoverpa armigera]
MPKHRRFVLEFGQRPIRRKPYKMSTQEQSIHLERKSTSVLSVKKCFESNCASLRRQDLKSLTYMTNTFQDGNKPLAIKSCLSSQKNSDKIKMKVKFLVKKSAKQSHCITETNSAHIMNKNFTRTEEDELKIQKPATILHNKIAFNKRAMAGDNEFIQVGIKGKQNNAKNLPRTSSLKSSFANKVKNMMVEKCKQPSDTRIRHRRKFIKIRSSNSFSSSLNYENFKQKLTNNDEHLQIVKDIGLKEKDVVKLEKYPNQCVSSKQTHGHLGISDNYLNDRNHDNNKDSNKLNANRSLHIKNSKKNASDKSNSNLSAVVYRDICVTGNRLELWQNHTKHKRRRVLSIRIGKDTSNKVMNYFSNKQCAVSALGEACTQKANKLKSWVADKNKKPKILVKDSPIKNKTQKAEHSIQFSDQSKIENTSNNENKSGTDVPEDPITKTIHLNDKFNKKTDSQNEWLSQYLTHSDNKENVQVRKLIKTKLLKSILKSSPYGSKSVETGIFCNQMHRIKSSLINQSSSMAKTDNLIRNTNVSAYNVKRHSVLYLNCKSDQKPISLSKTEEKLPSCTRSINSKDRKRLNVTFTDSELYPCSVNKNYDEKADQDLSIDINKFELTKSCQKLILIKENVLKLLQSIQSTVAVKLKHREIFPGSKSSVIRQNKNNKTGVKRVSPSITEAPIEQSTREGSKVHLKDGNSTITMNTLRKSCKKLKTDIYTPESDILDFTNQEFATEIDKKYQNAANNKCCIDSKFPSVHEKFSPRIKKQYDKNRSIEENQLKISLDKIEENEQIIPAVSNQYPENLKNDKNIFIKGKRTGISLKLKPSNIRIQKKDVNNSGHVHNKPREPHLQENQENESAQGWNTEITSKRSSIFGSSERQDKMIKQKNKKRKTGLFTKSIHSVFDIQRFSRGQKKTLPEYKIFFEELTKCLKSISDQQSYDSKSRSISECKYCIKLSSQPVCECIQKDSSKKFGCECLKNSYKNESTETSPKPTKTTSRRKTKKHVRDSNSSKSKFMKLSNCKCLLQKWVKSKHGIKISTHNVKIEDKKKKSLSENEKRGKHNTETSEDILKVVDKNGQRLSEIAKRSKYDKIKSADIGKLVDKNGHRISENEKRIENEIREINKSADIVKLRDKNGQKLSEIAKQSKYDKIKSADIDKLVDKIGKHDIETSEDILKIVDKNGQRLSENEKRSKHDAETSRDIVKHADKNGKRLSENEKQSKQDKEKSADVVKLADKNGHRLSENEKRSKYDKEKSADVVKLSDKNGQRLSENEKRSKHDKEKSADVVKLADKNGQRLSEHETRSRHDKEKSAGVVKLVDKNGQRLSENERRSKHDKEKPADVVKHVDKNGRRLSENEKRSKYDIKTSDDIIKLEDKNEKKLSEIAKRSKYDTGTSEETVKLEEKNGQRLSENRSKHDTETSRDIVKHADKNGKRLSENEKRSKHDKEKSADVVKLVDKNGQKLSEKAKRSKYDIGTSTETVNLEEKNGQRLSEHEKRSKHDKEKFADVVKLVDKNGQKLSEKAKRSKYDIGTSTETVNLEEKNGQRLSEHEKRSKHDKEKSADVVKLVDKNGRKLSEKAKRSKYDIGTSTESVNLEEKNGQRLSEHEKRSKHDKEKSADVVKLMDKNGRKLSEKAKRGKHNVETSTDTVIHVNKNEKSQSNETRGLEGDKINKGASVQKHTSGIFLKKLKAGKHFLSKRIQRDPHRTKTPNEKQQNLPHKFEKNAECQCPSSQTQDIPGDVSNKNEKSQSKGLEGDKINKGASEPKHTPGFFKKLKAGKPFFSKRNQQGSQPSKTPNEKKQKEEKNECHCSSSQKQNIPRDTSDKNEKIPANKVRGLEGVKINKGASEPEKDILRQISDKLSENTSTVRKIYENTKHIESSYKPTDSSGYSMSVTFNIKKLHSDSSKIKSSKISGFLEKIKSICLRKQQICPKCENCNSEFDITCIKQNVSRKFSRSKKKMNPNCQCDCLQKQITNDKQVTCNKCKKVLIEQQPTLSKLFLNWRNKEALYNEKLIVEHCSCKQSKIRKTDSGKQYSKSSSNRRINICQTQSCCRNKQRRHGIHLNIGRFNIEKRDICKICKKPRSDCECQQENSRYICKKCKKSPIVCKCPQENSRYICKKCKKSPIVCKCPQENSRYICRKCKISPKDCECRQENSRYICRKCKKSPKDCECQQENSRYICIKCKKPRRDCECQQENSRYICKKCKKSPKDCKCQQENSRYICRKCKKPRRDCECQQENSRYICKKCKKSPKDCKCQQENSRYICRKCKKPRRDCECQQENSRYFCRKCKKSPTDCECSQESSLYICRKCKKSRTECECSQEQARENSRYICRKCKKSRTDCECSQESSQYVCRKCKKSRTDCECLQEQTQECQCIWKNQSRNSYDLQTSQSKCVCVNSIDQCNKQKSEHGFFHKQLQLCKGFLSTSKQKKLFRHRRKLRTKLKSRATSFSCRHLNCNKKGMEPPPMEGPSLSHSKESKQSSSCNVCIKPPLDESNCLSLQIYLCKCNDQNFGCTRLVTGRPGKKKQGICLNRPGYHNICKSPAECKCKKISSDLVPQNSVTKQLSQNSGLRQHLSKCKKFLKSNFCGRGPRKVHNRRDENEPIKCSHEEKKQTHPKTAKKHTKILRKLSDTVKKHTECQTKHSETAIKHSETVKKVSETPKKHSECDKKHTETSKKHPETRKETVKKHSQAAKKHSKTAKKHPEIESKSLDHQKKLIDTQKKHSKSEIKKTKSVTYPSTQTKRSEIAKEHKTEKTKKQKSRRSKTKSETLDEPTDTSDRLKLLSHILSRRKRHILLTKIQLTTDRVTDLACRFDPSDCRLFIRTLRKKPCLCIYKLCPSAYPHFLHLLVRLRQLLSILIFGIAAVTWLPWFILVPILRLIVCFFA